MEFSICFMVFFIESFPQVALQYATDMKTIIVSEILTGKEYKGANRTWTGFNSKVVNSDRNNFAEFLIIKEKKQILPLATLELSAITPATLPIPLRTPLRSIVTVPAIQPPPPPTHPSFYFSSKQPQFFMRPFLPPPVSKGVSYHPLSQVMSPFATTSTTKQPTPVAVIKPHLGSSPNSNQTSSDMKKKSKGKKENS